MSSNLWEPAVACNGNLWFPGWEQWVPTFGKRQFLAMNQTQTFRYRAINQNKAFFTGPLIISFWHARFSCQNIFMPAQQPNANIPLPVYEAKQKVLLPAQ